MEHTALLRFPHLPTHMALLEDSSAEFDPNVFKLKIVHNTPHKPFCSAFVTINILAKAYFPKPLHYP